MKLISLDALEPGKILGRPIFNEKGTLLLGSGVAVSERYLRRLKELGYASVYIREKGYEDIEVKDVISDETRRDAVSVIADTYKTLRENPSTKKVSVDKHKITGLVDKIVDELTSTGDQIMDMVDLKSFDNYTFLHSVNTCVLTMLTVANTGKFNALELRDLSMGALLADIGKTHLPIEIVQKRGKLSEDEFSEMKRHSKIGYEILQHRSNIKPVVASVALQHHEQYDGAGYPNGLDFRNIHIYSRYTTLADVYDALTSDRSFKKRLPPHIAVKYIRMGRGSQFDPDCMDNFIKHIAFYPTGSTVLLNTGQKAVVVSNDPKKLDRPKIRILTSPDGSQLSKPFEIDLAVTRDYKIENVEF